jgi:hypothetical protein
MEKFIIYEEISDFLIAAIFCQKQELSSPHRALGHSHDVGIIWNFYPFNWLFLPPTTWIFDILILPITLLTWPLWWIWNFLTLPLAIIFFPAWVIYMVF